MVEGCQRLSLFEWLYALNEPIRIERTFFTNQNSLSFSVFFSCCCCLHFYLARNFFFILFTRTQLEHSLSRQALDFICFTSRRTNKQTNKQANEVYLLVCLSSWLHKSRKTMRAAAAEEEARGIELNSICSRVRQQQQQQTEKQSKRRPT